MCGQQLSIKFQFSQHCEWIQTMDFMWCHYGDELSYMLNLNNTFSASLFDDNVKKRWLFWCAQLWCHANHGAKVVACFFLFLFNQFVEYGFQCKKNKIRWLKNYFVCINENFRIDICQGRAFALTRPIERRRYLIMATIASNGSRTARAKSRFL